MPKSQLFLQILKYRVAILSTQNWGKTTFFNYKRRHFLEILCISFSSISKQSFEKYCQADFEIEREIYRKDGKNKGSTDEHLIRTGKKCLKSLIP